MKEQTSYLYILIFLTTVLFCQCNNNAVVPAEGVETTADSAIEKPYDQEIPFESMEYIGNIESRVRSTLDQSPNMQEVSSTRSDMDSMPVKFVEFRDSMGIRVRIDFIPESVTPFVQYTWIGDAKEWLWLGKRSNAATNHRDSFQECFYIKNNQPFAYKQLDLSVSNKDINTFFPVEALTWLKKIEKE